MKKTILTPFKRWTIQNFPFIEEDFDAITNYQLLCKIVEYLNNVIKDVDGLELNVKELTEYILNLDLQDEVDKKLDEMVESGQLQEIISAYLDSKAILGFNNIADLKSATNFVEGSIAYILGSTILSDGLGAFYHIRTLTIYDVIDNFELVSLTNYPTLVAQRIHNADVENNINNINIINSKQVVFLGDSYGALETNWVNTFIELNNLTLNTDCYNFCTGGSGLLGSDSTNTYLTNLQNNESSIPNKNMIKAFIICGGWNDRTKSASELEAAMEDLVGYIKENYINAKIYVGMIGNTGMIDDVSGAIHFRRWLITQVLPGYKSVENYGGHYLQGVENVLHKYDLFNTYDYVHPNADGCVALGKAISIAYNQGYYNYTSNGMYEGLGINNTNYTFEDSINTNSQINIVGNIYNGIYDMKVNGTINFTSYYLMSSNVNPEITITHYTANQKYFRNVDHLTEIPVLIKYKTFETTPKNVATRGLIKFKTDGSITLTVYNILEEQRYLQQINILPSSYSLPFICQ